MNKTVFVVQHVHLLPHGEEDVKLIGVYGSRDAAVAATKRLATQPGFRDCSAIAEPMTAATNDQGFYIDEYVLDQDHWAEGYVAV